MSKTTATVSTNKKKKVPFEHSLKALEALVKKMDSGELSLEESLTAFEEGIRLIRDCQNTLQTAEQKVQMLIESNGEITTQPFAEDDDNE